MCRLLNRGLNFSVLPKHLDITQVRVDYKRFERSAIWQEYFYGKDEDKKEEPIFKEYKTNLPNNYTIPEGLKTFLGAVKSDITDHRNRNSVECNLPKEELEALNDLIKLQKDRKIIIKACDKGAGIIILNYKEYMRACYMHLTAEQTPGVPYYSPVSLLALEDTKTKIDTILHEALVNNIISKKEFCAMDPKEKGPGCFYCTFKVHKPHQINQAPPERPITSQSGSVCEGIATYVEHHIKHIATKHDSYIEDTPDFLRLVRKVNCGPKLSENTLLVTMDVKA